MAVWETLGSLCVYKATHMHGKFISTYRICEVKSSWYYIIDINSSDELLKSFE